MSDRFHRRLPAALALAAVALAAPSPGGAGDLTAALAAVVTSFKPAKG